MHRRTCDDLRPQHRAAIGSSPTRRLSSSSSTRSLPGQEVACLHRVSGDQCGPAALLGRASWRTERRGSWPRSPFLAGAFLMLHVPSLGAANGMQENEEHTWASEPELLAHLQPPLVGVEVLPMIRLAISRSWWEGARVLVTQEHARRVDESAAPGIETIKAEVTALVAEVKQQADAFAAYSEEVYRSHTQGLNEVRCAVQWAQNSTDVFVGVKYATRWSAPGAIEIADLKVNITAPHFALEGFGHHSNIRKKYLVNVPLYADVLPSLSSWSAASVGRMTATLRKASVAKWPRLTKAKGKSQHQTTSWLDMEEKWAEELRKRFEKPKKAKDKTDKRKETKESKKDSKPSGISWKKTLLKKWRLWRSWLKKQPQSMRIAGTLGITALISVLLYFGVRRVGAQGCKSQHPQASAISEACADEASREERAAAALARASNGGDAATVSAASASAPEAHTASEPE